MKLYVQFLGEIHVQFLLSFSLQIPHGLHVEKEGSSKKGIQQVMVSVTGFFLLLDPHLFKSVYFLFKLLPSKNLHR